MLSLNAQKKNAPIQDICWLTSVYCSATLNTLTVTLKLNKKALIIVKKPGQVPEFSMRASPSFLSEEFIQLKKFENIELFGTV